MYLFRESFRQVLTQDKCDDTEAKDTLVFGFCVRHVEVGLVKNSARRNTVRVDAYRIGWFPEKLFGKLDERL